jgi:hypothetical protein
MSGTVPVQFQGSVRADRRAGGALLVLHGIERGSALPLTVSFSGLQSLEVPADLRDVAVMEAGNAGAASSARRWHLHSAAGDTPAHDTIIEARAMHVQRDVAAAFAAAVPPCRASAASRAGWTVLLNLVRIPGALRLLQRLRSRVS